MEAETSNDHPNHYWSMRIGKSIQEHKKLDQKARSGAHDTDRFIFRLNFPRMRLPQEPDDQSQET